MPVEPVHRLQYLGRDGVEQNRQFVANEADGHDDRESDSGGEQGILNGGGAGLVLERLELLAGPNTGLQHNTLLNRFCQTHVPQIATQLRSTRAKPRLCTEKSVGSQASMATYET